MPQSENDQLIAIFKKSLLKATERMHKANREEWNNIAKSSWLDMLHDMVGVSCECQQGEVECILKISEKIIMEKFGNSKLNLDLFSGISQDAALILLNMRTKTLTSIIQ
jgi:hypothetical protein